MCSVLHLVRCTVVLLITYTGANGMIQKTDSSAREQTCSCGKSLTLTCKLAEKTSAMAWMNENDFTPIAQCYLQFCKLNPVYLGQYTFSSDLDRTTFNLTILKVTTKDNGRKILCSDGLNVDYTILRVIYDEPQLFEDTKNGALMATSGCISQNRNVTFEWILVDVDSKMEKEIQPQILDANMTSCLNTSDCSHNGKVQYTEMVYARASNNGKCYVKIAALYGNERKVTPNTVGKYLFEEQDNKRLYGHTSANASVVIGVVGFTVIVTAFCLYKRHTIKYKAVRNK